MHAEGKVDGGKSREVAAKGYATKEARKAASRLASGKAANPLLEGLRTREKTYQEEHTGIERIRTKQVSTDLEPERRLSIHIHLNSLGQRSDLSGVRAGH